MRFFFIGTNFPAFAVFSFQGQVPVCFKFRKKPERLTVNPTLNLIPLSGLCKLWLGSFTYAKKGKTGPFCCISIH
jgi:hypothetical protein